jgi:hypothetical protein
MFVFGVALRFENNGVVQITVRVKHKKTALQRVPKGGFLLFLKMSVVIHEDTLYSVKHESEK